MRRKVGLGVIADIWSISAARSITEPARSAAPNCQWVTPSTTR
jgi:hypothetical protein